MSKLTADLTGDAATPAAQTQQVAPTSADTVVSAAQAGTGEAAGSGSASPPARAGRDDFRTFDLTAFIRAKRETRGTVLLSELSRVCDELPPDAPSAARQESLSWSARGETRREVRRDAPTTGRAQADAALTTTSHTVSQPYLTLTIHGRSWLECQRCMKAFEFPIDIDTLYKVMDTEEEADAIALDEGEAEVIVGSQAFDLYDLIDEEIVLSYPMVPKHDVCPAVHESVVSGADGSLGVESVEDIEARVAAAEEEAPLPGEKPANPFAALSGLRKKLASDGDA